MQLKIWKYDWPFNTIYRMDGGGVKKPPPLISFSPVTSTNIGVISQNFLTFIFNLFATLV